MNLSLTKEMEESIQLDNNDKGQENRGDPTQAKFDEFFALVGAAFFDFIVDIVRNEPT